MVYNTGCTIANNCNGSWGGLWFALILWAFIGLVAGIALWLIFREKEGEQ